MKQRIPTRYIAWLALGFGLVGLMLMTAMYTLCVDDRGLLIRGNPFYLAAWGVNVLAALVLIPVLRPLGGHNAYGYNFWPSIPAALGAVLAAAGILATVLDPARYPQDNLTLLWQISGGLAAAGLTAVAICRWRGKQPFFLLYATVCLFFALHLANQYRIWSGNPQTQDYSFQLLACIFVMLFGYYQTAFTVGSGKRRAQLFAGLMGFCLCCTAMAGSETSWLYPGCALWLLADRCTMSPPNRRHTQEEPQGTQPPEEVA